jgi:hypothetical protein
MSVLQLLGVPGASWGCGVRINGRLHNFIIRAGETVDPLPNEIIPYVKSAQAAGNRQLLLGDSPIPLRQRKPTGHYRSDLAAGRDGGFEPAISDIDQADLDADEAAREERLLTEYKCGLCDAAFPHPAPRARHREMHHEGVPIPSA